MASMSDLDNGLAVQDKGNGKGSLGCKLWPLNKHVEFDHQHAWQKSAAASAPSLKPTDVKYNAKVCLRKVLHCTAPSSCMPACTTDRSLLQRLSLFVTLTAVSH